MIKHEGGDSSDEETSAEQESSASLQTKQLSQASLLSRIRRLTHRLAWKINPQWAARRVLRENKEDNDRRDARSTISAALPEGEQIGVRCVWVVELYLASHIERLGDGLRSLGLHVARHSELDPIDWIMKSRAYAGGQLSLEPMFSPSWSNLPYGVRATLPAGVRTIVSTINPVVPGVTALICQFHFEDASAREIEQPFDTHYSSTTRAEPRRIVHIRGSDVRAEAVENVRRQMVKRCTRWMNHALPGLFASGAAESTPSCEILTLEVGDPLNGRTPATYDDGRNLIYAGPRSDTERGTQQLLGSMDYLRILGLSTDFEAWTSPSDPGLVLRLHSASHLRSSDERLVLVARVPTFGNDSPYFSRTPDGIATYLESYHGSLTIFALWRALRSFELQIAQIRDRLGTVRLGRTGNAVASVQAVETELARVHRDARVLMRNLRQTPISMLRMNESIFVPLDERRRSEPSLFTWMSDELYALSKRLLKEEREVRETAQGMSALIVGAANLRAARWNIRLQVLTIVLSFLAAAFSALALPPIWAAFVLWIR